MRGIWRNLPPTYVVQANFYIASVAQACSDLMQENIVWFQAIQGLKLRNFKQCKYKNPYFRTGDLLGMLPSVPE